MADGTHAALLSALDARGRAELGAAGRRRSFEPGASVFAPGEPADTVCVVERGAVAVEAAGERPVVRAGELFGREAFAAGGVRSGHARATEASVVLEIPAGALRRALARCGAAELFAREEARARERAWVSLLAGSPLGAGVSVKALRELVKSAREEQRTRGEPLFLARDPAHAGFIVLRGLVELSAGDESKRFAAAGEVLGFRETLAGGTYDLGATALGDVLSLRIPAGALAAFAREHGEPVLRAERAAAARRERQARVEALGEGRATRHAFHELERLASARSLLAIDLETCVRCGHCAWACADTHGTARLERRGDKVALAVREADGTPAERALLLAKSCQHCKDPACLSECPTGAISRAPDGAVLLRDDLCTGCGACAKACPWDAVRMTPRGTGLVASKCDLCHGHAAGPACVNACPTGSIFRAEPARDFVALSSVLGRGAAKPRAASRPAYGLWLVLAALPPLVAGARVAAASESSAVRFVTGLLAAVACGVLALHAVVKRHPRARNWLENALPAARSARGVERFVSFHSMTGALALALVLAHAGLSVPRGTAGALLLCFWFVAATGVAGAVLYRVLPRRLARLERRGSLPEDRADEREALRQALFAGLSAQNEAVKELARRVLVPYSKAAGGALALVLSGRSLAAEEAVLSARIRALLGGRKSERLAEVGPLVGVAVAVRALGARRLLEAALRAWLPLHALGVVALLALLALHVAGVLR